MKREKLKNLLKEIEKGEDFIFNEEKNLIIVFNGGHGANVYSLYNNGEEVDYFTFGSFAKNKAEKEEFREAANEYINNLDY